MTSIIIIITLFAIVTPVLLIKGTKVVQQNEVMIVERLGQYTGTLQPGLHLIIPVIDQARAIPWQFIETDKQGNKSCVIRKTETIPLSENFFYLLKHSVVTKNNYKIELDVIVSYNVVDPLMLVYNIASLPMAFERTIDHTLGDLDLQDVNAATLLKILRKETEKFGIKINDVDVKNVKY